MQIFSLKKKFNLSLERGFCEAVQRGGGVTIPGRVREITGCDTLCYGLGDKLAFKDWTQ